MTIQEEFLLDSLIVFVLLSVLPLQKLLSFLAILEEAVIVFMLPVFFNSFNLILVMRFNKSIVIEELLVLGLSFFSLITCASVIELVLHFRGVVADEVLHGNVEEEVIA